MIKAVLFDIDETLYSHKIKDYPSLNIKAISKLKEKGIRIGLCTKRELGELPSIYHDFFKQLDMIVCASGALLLQNDKLICAHTINKEDLKKYFNYLIENNISYIYFDVQGNIYYQGDFNDKQYDQISEWIKNGINAPYNGQDISSLYFYSQKQEDIENIRSINTRAYISPCINCTQLCGVDLGKGQGTREFMSLLNIKKEELLVFGDSFDDVDMFKEAGISVAVKDSKPYALENADYVLSKSIEDGGIYEFLIEQGILENKKHDIKAFFFDIDSTTFDHSIFDVRESTYKAIELLNEKGYYTSICTGRSILDLQNLPQKFLNMLKGKVLCSGACQIVNDKTYYKIIDKKELQDGLKILDEQDFTYRYVVDDGTDYLSRHDEDAEVLFYRLYHYIPVIKPYEGENVCLMNVYNYHHPQRQDDLPKYFPGSTVKKLGITTEITPANTDKASAILEVGERLGLKRENICAFGDGINDITMVETAGLGIAMGNGNPKLKQVADYITDDISDEGLYNACLKFGFIDEK